MSSYFTQTAAVSRLPRSISDKLVDIAERVHIPLTSAIELTLRCNLRCQHCYNFDRSSTPIPARELEPHEVVNTLDALANLGCIFLTFTGGEVLVHPHLESFIQHARHRHMQVKLKTNGSLVTKRRALALAHLGTESLDVSLYGMSSATHDAFTMRPGSFDATIAGIRNAVDSGIRTSVNYVVTRHNVHEVEEALEFAESTPCRVVFSPQLTRRHDGSDPRSTHIVEQSDLLRLYGGPLRALLQLPRPGDQGPPRCGCALSVCGITAVGDVYPCIGAPMRCGNIRQQTLQEIWTTSPQLQWIRQLRDEDFRTCVQCHDRAYCQRSSGATLTNTGDFVGPEPFACMDAAVARQIHTGEFRPPANRRVNLAIV